MIENGDNPYEVSPEWESIQLAPKPKPEVYPRTLTRKLLIAIAITCLIGGSLAYFEFTSVIICGPAFFLASLGLLVEEYTCRRRGGGFFGTAMYLGLMGVIFVPTIAWLIISNQTVPKGLHATCAMFAAVSLVIALKALFQLRGID